MAQEDSSADRYHPQMPSIPGVPAGERPARRRSGGIRPGRLVAAIAVMLVAALAVAAWIRHNTRALQSSQLVAAAAQTDAPTQPIVLAPSAAPETGDSGEIGPLADLSKPWSSRAFTFVRPFTHEGVPAMVVRLPGAAGSNSSYWAFSLAEPFGTCQMTYLSDIALISSQYGYAAKHPMVVDPCTQTVFDPLRMGQRADGAWIRGAVVQGGGLRPPLEIELSVRGGNLYADRME